MANVIQIKHGTSKPVNGTLKSFELGFDEISKKLYIGDKNEVPILLTPEIPKIPTIENQTIKPANIIIKKNQHYIDDASGIDLQNSDIIGINGLYLNQTDSTPTPYEGAGIFFQSNNDKWNRLYEFEGELYYRKQVTKGGGVTPGETPRMIYHSGMTIAIPITEGGTGATTKADVIANIINGQSIEPSSIKVTGGIDLQNSNIININELSGESIKVTSIRVDSITFSSEKYGNNSAIDMNNSNIEGINSLRFHDSCQAWDEGIFFHRTGTFWDKFYALNGALYFWTDFNTEAPEGKIPEGDPNKKYEVYHSGNFPIEKRTITIAGNAGGENKKGTLTFSREVKAVSVIAYSKTNKYGCVSAYWDKTTSGMAQAMTGFIIDSTAQTNPARVTFNGNKIEIERMGQIECTYIVTAFFNMTEIAEEQK